MRYRGAAWSPDGKAIAIVVQDKLRVLDGATLEIRHEVKGGFGKAFAVSTPVGVAWSPAGDEILTAGFSDAIEVWRASDLSRVRRFSQSEGTCALAFGADGSRVLAGGNGVATRIWGFASGAVEEELVPAPSRVLAVAWSPDGRVAATGDEAGGVRVWDLASHQAIAQYGGAKECRWGFLVCPSVEVLAFASDSSSVVWNAGANVMQWFFARDAEILAAAGEGNTLLPGQRRALMEREDMFRVFAEPELGPQHETTGAYSEGFPPLTVARDGSRVAVRTTGVVHVYNMISGAVISSLPAASGSFILLSSDGSRLLQEGIMFRRLALHDLAEDDSTSAPRP
jgi:WD40 repeat protein